MLSARLGSGPRWAMTVLATLLVMAAAAVGLAGCQIGAVARPVSDLAGLAYVVANDVNEAAPQLSAADLDRARSAVDGPESGAKAWVVAAGRPEVEEVDLEPRRENGEVEHGPRRTVLRDARLAELQRAIDRGAAEGADVDLLRALAAASRTPAALIVVLSSGMSTTAPFDQRVVGWDQDPDVLAADLHDRGYLPDLGGRAVVFSGLARTAGGQPALPLPQRTQLMREWIAICRAAGAASCTSNDEVRQVRPPLSTLTSPVVDVPDVSTTPGPVGVQVISVPAPLLFAPDRCDLLAAAAAGAALRPLADQLRGGRYTVSISGRTAPVGPGDGTDLATCRAHAAAGILTSLGVPASSITAVRGDGSLLDPPEASHDAQGRLDPAKLPALRRVVFTLTPANPA